MPLEHLMVLPACWASVCGQAVEKSPTCGIAVLRRSSRIYFGVAFLVFTCYMLEILYKWTILCKKKNAFSFSFHIFQKLVEKQTCSKDSLCPKDHMLGCFLSKMGSFLGPFHCPGAPGPSKVQEAVNTIRCDQFSEIGTIACGFYNFHTDQIYTDLGYFYQRYVAV
ncbi:hypothetical protein AB205_0152630 [Aquarana catesbeiana]|uniref:Uncharacterized protein n=1 Tax=Aquarana catesbeiana TaxID=8400 RepID=A0A2G9SG95_AQUCT|nr:hypothetical protein AB205_0152630 [Aquarana catesbeiana]